MPDNKGTIICAVGCGVCVTVTLLIGILISVGTVEPIEYGIKYNALTKKVDTS